MCRGKTFPGFVSETWVFEFAGSSLLLSHTWAHDETAQSSSMALVAA